MEYVEDRRTDRVPSSRLTDCHRSTSTGEGWMLNEKNERSRIIGSSRTFLYSLL